MITINNIQTSDHAWIKKLLTQSWGSSLFFRDKKPIDASELPGFVAWENNRRKGLITYDVHDGSCEIVTLNSLEDNKGIGSILISAIENELKVKGVTKIYLTPTNDNTRALKFYQKRGYSISKVILNCMDAKRKSKPEIPKYGNDGIEIRDEIFLEKTI